MKPAQPSEAESRVIALPSGPVGVIDEGEGPTVVALHGLPGSTYDYRWLAPALTDRARLVRLDLPGFGKTPAGGVGRTIDARGAWVAGVIEALGLSEVVVVGHSMGGPVAVSAARRSDRVRALGLLCSVGPVPHRFLRTKPGLRAACHLMYSDRFARLMLPWLRPAYARMGFRRVTDDAIVQTARIIARFRFSTHRANLAALRKPTLVAWAADDRLVEDAIGDRLYWLAPAGPRIRFETGGHNIQATRATELGQALAAWVRDPRSPPREEATPG